MRQHNMDTCARCGNPMPVTRATLAAGLQHPRCRYGYRGLTASAADLDAHALRVWALRASIAQALRRHGAFA